MRDTDKDIIRGLRLFADVEADKFDSLMMAAYAQRFPAHVDLIREGETADFLYIVLEGSVELFSTSHGRETSMAIVAPVSTFILAATIKDAPYLMAARTLEPSKLLLIPSSNVRTVFGDDPAFARAIVTELASCYRSVVKSMKNLKLRTAIERVGNYIIRLHDKSGKADIVELPFGKRNLASILGMTPENLSRAFGALQSHGIMMDGARIEILDRAALEAISKPNPLIDDPRS
ncbi:helix-turn-helix domain-containing protein [Hyphobacterium marinum]|uniref:Cyclic nucleotide-binding domain-containing protein n=1 Tax=Hyphobacterium marinum TaxID=3116574 RepID=A0ABU7LU64_9PROT|nr:cyclic nucleotide-binding domain-containing protein [Hyphobacterium sp. Y6023]MEE2565098.1 cyclic nucleotide-binding domain-containing protein [Hyphobacterium sp. Y6023]